MATHRKHGEGTIRRRADGRWEAMMTLDNGKRQSFYGKTQREVRERLTEALRNRDVGLPMVRDERLTVASYVERWLDTVKPSIKLRTHQRYGEALRLHALPAFGRVTLAKLTAAHLQALYAAMLRDGLSPTTAHHVHVVAHKALEDALRLGLVARNVADLVTPPRPARPEMRPLTPEQAQTLFLAAQGERLEALYVLAVHTGMRLGELLALHWRDVDLDGLDSAEGGHAHPVLHVRYTLYHPRGNLDHYVLSTPKSAQSRRRIDLNPSTVAALRAHRARQHEERLALGEAFTDGDFVFCRVDGRPLRGAHVYQRQFLPLLQRAGLPLIRFHDLRHTAATLLLLDHVPVKVVSELLGHSSTSITSDRYSHVLPSMQRDAAAAMERMLQVRAK